MRVSRGVVSRGMSVADQRRAVSARGAAVRRLWPLVAAVSATLGGGSSVPEKAVGPSSGSDQLLHPILFMGGLGASMLHADLNRTSVPHWYCSKQEKDYPLWLYYRNFEPFREQCWMENMRLEWRNGSLQDSGVKVKFVGDNLPAGSDISAGFPKDLWGDLLNSVAGLGYSGTSAHVGALHYDWRLGPLELVQDGTYAKMKRQIEEFVAKSSGKRAVLVTLSYGGVEEQAHREVGEPVRHVWRLS